MPLVRDGESPQVFWSVPREWTPDGVAVATPDVAQLLRFIARSPRTPTRDALMRKLLPADTVAAITPNAADLPERESTLARLEDAQARKRAVRLLYTTAKTGTDSFLSGATP
jgi:hypothetical protein